jgi:hypothetical protein
MRSGLALALTLAAAALLSAAVLADLAGGLLDDLAEDLERPRRGRW